MMAGDAAVWIGPNILVEITGRHEWALDDVERFLVRFHPLHKIHNHKPFPIEAKLLSGPITDPEAWFAMQGLGA